MSKRTFLVEVDSTEIFDAMKGNTPGMQLQFSADILGPFLTGKTNFMEALSLSAMGIRVHPTHAAVDMPEWAKWYRGIPPVDVVLAHSTAHLRFDGIRLHRATMTHGKDATFKVEEVVCDADMMSDWIHLNESGKHFFAHPSFTRLKVLSGRVCTCLGYTQWHPLDEMPWAKDSLFYPVQVNGLPLDYGVPDPEGL